ncbi:MAG: PA2778 family cysteine peptidase, partial [Burkholderiales bacterium]|nr:PA2778 family cysteine peptidase [Burkholderiales bacterium]
MPRPDRGWPARAAARLSRVAAVLAAALLLGACVSLPQSDALRQRPPPDLPTRVELAVPFFGERDDFCGPSSLAMILAHAGVDVEVPRLASQVYVPGRGGSLQVEMLAAPRAHGLVGTALPPRLDAVLNELAAGAPVVMLVNLGFRSLPAWHYLVATGYDLERGELHVHSAPHPDQRMRFDRVEYLWRTSRHWSMVALPPERVPATADVSAHASGR